MNCKIIYFPTRAGIASSASAFAALAVASSRAIGLELSERELSRLARRGSGSACRSIPGGFVEWITGNCDDDSYAEKSHRQFFGKFWFVWQFSPAER